MTTKNVLEALATIAPAEIDRISRPGPRCVMATRVGKLVLDEFEIAAEPFVVELSLFNQAWKEWAEECNFAGGPDEQLRRGAHLLTNTPNWGGGTLPSLNPVSKGPWDGHLVLRVQSWLVDLDLGQCARPSKGIHVPPALVAKLTPNETVEGCFAHAGTNTYVAYQPLKADCADEYKTAPDWKRPPSTYDATVETIYRKMTLALGR